MPRKGSGVPAQRGDSRGALAEATRHRSNALIGRALDRIVNDPKGRDPGERLAEEYWNDPKGFITWVDERCGGSAQAPSAALAGLAGVFAGAAAVAAGAAVGADLAAAGEPNPPYQTIDMTPARVQSGCNDAQAIDNEW